MKSSKSKKRGRELTERDIEDRLRAVRDEKKRVTDSSRASRYSAPQSASPRGYAAKDVVKRGYRFIRDEEEDSKSEESWEKTISKSYHDSLDKAFALADFSRYKEGKIGFRWRLEREVLSGKGESICGNKKCSNVQDLDQVKVPFRYNESKETKSALVNLTVCPDCALKLIFYKEETQSSTASSSSKKSKRRPSLEGNSRSESEEEETVRVVKKRKLVE